MTVDPITLEVIRHHLSATAEEMSLTVMRAARSPVLREAGDLSSAITDAGGDLVAQGQDIPMHMGVMSFSVREFLKRVPTTRLRPGDVWLLNLPEIGGNHLPDVKAIRPVFADSRALGLRRELGALGGYWGCSTGELLRAGSRCLAGGAAHPAPTDRRRGGLGRGKAGVPVRQRTRAGRAARRSSGADCGDTNGPSVA